jgi:transcriptional regulator with XRE-family HTH domain
MAKTPNPVDLHVGRRARMRRLMLGMSQTTLGEKIGITFQQIQKYEKGTNRISASRLQQLSRILQVPVPFFFEGLSDDKGQTRQPDYVAEFLATSEGLALIDAIARIQNAPLRHSIVNLVDEIAQSRSKRAKPDRSRI